MRPSPRCCPGLSSGLAETTRKYSVLWEISVTVKHLINKASPALLNLQNRGQILETEQKMYASYRRVRGLGCMTVLEMLKTMHENDLFDMFPEFSNVLHITSSDTCYIVFCRTIIQCVAQIENVPPQHHGATTCQ